MKINYWLQIMVIIKFSNQTITNRSCLGVSDLIVHKDSFSCVVQSQVLALDLRAACSEILKMLNINIPFEDLELYPHSTFTI